MAFIDTHTHLYQPAFDGDRDEAMARCAEAGVNTLLLPNIDCASIPRVHAMMDQWPDRCLGMMGLHPCHVKSDSMEQELSTIEDVLRNSGRRYVAVGEIGMDLYWDKTYQSQQQYAFARQIDWALAADLPIVIHCRDAFAPIFEVLEGVRDNRLRGVFHCFTVTIEDAQRALDLNFYLGIGGVVTFKNGKIDRFLADFPIEKMLLETDSPYLAPTPHRGKRNESAYLPIVANKMAELFEITPVEMAKITSKNAQQLFDLS